MGIDGSEIKKRNELLKAKNEKQKSVQPEITLQEQENDFINQKINSDYNEKLTNCEACGKEISRNAPTCPHCGEPKDINISSPPHPPKAPQKLGCAGSFLLIFIVLWIASRFVSNDTTTKNRHPEEKKIRTPSELRIDQIKNCFSQWDGSHRGLTPIIKKAMNDPDSYDHVETKYFDMKDHLVVITSFRGKNAFGGVVKNFIKAKTDINNCHVIEVIEQQD